MEKIRDIALAIWVWLAAAPVRKIFVWTSAALLAPGAVAGYLMAVRRTLLAFGICAIILLIWTTFMVGPSPVSPEKPFQAEVEARKYTMQVGIIFMIGMTFAAGALYRLGSRTAPQVWLPSPKVGMRVTALAGFVLALSAMPPFMAAVSHQGQIIALHARLDYQQTLVPKVDDVLRHYPDKARQIRCHMAVSLSPNAKAEMENQGHDTSCS